MASAQWRPFLRALAEEIDSLANPAERDDMLRGVGGRMARLMPLPQVATLHMLSLEMNEVLASLGFGQASLSVDEADRYLVITHTGLPRVGSAGDPPGTWLSALLEGLYEHWLAAQPGADPALVANRFGKPDADVITLRYGRAEAG